MAISPTLGTGLFLGLGQALAAGGPASLLGSYIFLSILIYYLTTALTEVASHVPSQNGTMIMHTYRYSSKHLGFSLSYLRWYSMAMLVPFEITTAMVNLGLWQPGPKIAIRISVVIMVIFGFNMLPEKYFKRSETIFTGLKLITTVMLITTSIYFAISGFPGTRVHGFHYWRQPGAFREYLFGGDLGRFLGLLQCLLLSTVSFIFMPELTVQRAEQANSEPGLSIHSGPRNDNILLSVLYFLSALASTMMSPYDDPLLTNYGIGAGLSPFIVGIKKANIPPLSTAVTVLIFLSSVASGRSFLFTASRILCALAENGHAPDVFNNRNKWGVPYVSVAASAVFLLFSYLSMATSSSAVVNFLMFFITTSGYISWTCSSVVYLRFRSVTNPVVPLSYTQPFGAYVSIFVSVLLSAANMLQIFFVPRSQFNPNNAIPAFVGIIVFLLVYVGHWIASRSTLHPFDQHIAWPHSNLAEIHSLEQGRELSIGS